MICGTNKDEKAKNIVGDIIKRLRSEKGISQKQLSDSFNDISWVQTIMSASTLSKIERGKRCVTDIEVAAFASALKISVSSLYDEN